jgi:hypothetical protein
MSAWRVGTDLVAPKVLTTPDDQGGARAAPPPGGAPAAGGGPAQNPLQSKIDNLAKWIPGDSIAVYGAVVTAWASSHGPSVVLLILGIVFTAVLVILGAFASSGSVPGKTWLAAGLAAVAFTIWSLSIPSSGWQKWHVVNQNQALVAIVAGVLALLFGLVAQGISKKFST